MDSTYLKIRSLLYSHLLIWGLLMCFSREFFQSSRLLGWACLLGSGASAYAGKQGYPTIKKWILEQNAITGLAMAFDGFVYVILFYTLSLITFQPRSIYYSQLLWQLVFEKVVIGMAVFIIGLTGSKIYNWTRSSLEKLSEIKQEVSQARPTFNYPDSVDKDIRVDTQWLLEEMSPGLQLKSAPPRLQYPYRAYSDSTMSVFTDKMDQPTTMIRARESDSWIPQRRSLPLRLRNALPSRQIDWLRDRLSIRPFLRARLTASTVVQRRSHY